MFARVSTYEGRPEQLDEMHQEGMEHVLPALEMRSAMSQAKSGRRVLLPQTVSVGVWSSPIVRAARCLW